MIKKRVSSPTISKNKQTKIDMCEREKELPLKSTINFIIIL